MIRISELTHNYKYIPSNGNLQNQIIVKHFLNGLNYIWNFNADLKEDIIGKLTKKSHFGFIDMFQIKEETWYKRIIFEDHIKIIKMTDQEFSSYLYKIKARK